MDFIGNNCYKKLDTKLSKIELNNLRSELAPYIDMAEEYLEKNDRPFQEYKEFQEVIIGIGHNSPDNIFWYDLPGIEIKTFEFDNFWACYYFNKEGNNFFTLVHKTYQGPFNTLKKIINKSIIETNYRLGKPKTINLLRTAPNSSWFRHLDVANRKVIIPIYSKSTSFKWYETNDSASDDYLEKIQLKENDIYVMNSHILHTSINLSSTPRWNLTFEEAII